MNIVKLAPSVLEVASEELENSVSKLEKVFKDNVSGVKGEKLSEIGEGFEYVNDE